MLPTTRANITEVRGNAREFDTDQDRQRQIFDCNALKLAHFLPQIIRTQKPIVNAKRDLCQSQNWLTGEKNKHKKA